jgi:tetratricopeptide (TPR) repeat protein
MRTFECLCARGVARALFASVLLAVASLTAACSDPEKLKAEHVARAEAHLKERKFQEAALEFRNAIQIDENLAGAHWGLAQAYEGLERYNEAFDELLRAVKLDPNNKDARFKLGTYQLLGSQRNNQTVNSELLEEANRQADELLKQDANFIPGHILKANILAARGDRKAALDALNHAIQLDPKRIESHVSLGAFYWGGGDIAKAEETFKRATQVNDRASLAYVEYGKFLAQQKRADEAEAQFRKAVEVDPQNRDVRWVLASFYLLNQKLDRAEETFKSLAELDGDRPEGRARLADFYASTGRLDEAINLYREVVKRSADFSRGHYRIGELLLQKGDREGAAAQTEEILKKNAGDLDALLLRGRLRLEKSQVKEAIADLKRILEQEPRSQLALYFMSEAQLRDGQTEQARAFAGDLERFHPDFLPAKLMQLQINLASGDTQAVRRQATELLDRLKQTAPGVQQTPQLLSEISVRALTARGTAAVQEYNASGRRDAASLNAARADMEAARAQWPNSPSSYTNLAGVAATEGKLEEALGQYERALALDRTNFQALDGLIKLYGALNRPADARARLDQLVAENQQNAQLHYLKAVAYAQGNQNSPADPQVTEAALVRAAELDPNFVPAYQRLAELYFNTKQHDRSVAEYRKVAERRPDDAAPHSHIGMVEYSRQNYDAAAESYRQALARNPNDDIAANNLAMLYAERDQGNIDDAVRLAQEVVRRHPQEPGFADTLGWVYYKKGVYAAAADQLQKAVTLAAARGGDNSTYRYHLGLALAGKGDKAGARRELQAALRLAEGEAQRQRPSAPVADIQRTLGSL